MVRRGEYLERAVVIPGEPPLEALYHRGRAGPPIVIAPPHPERGGGMESPVVAELAWALTRAGHPTLRFNYPGVGASAGRFEPEGLAPARDRALEHLEASAGGPLAGIGVGLGGPLLLEAALSAPSLGPLVWIMPDAEAPRPDLSGFDRELWVVVAEHEDPSLREALSAWLQTGRATGLRTVPGADPWYRRGLVTLGQVVVDLLDPPGAVELPIDDTDFLE